MAHVPQLRPALEEEPPLRFVEDRISVQLVSGVLFSPVGIGPDAETLNTSQTNLRLGWMLNSPSEDAHPLRGNFEALIELSTSGIFEGAGSLMIGPTALVRYNFVQPDWKVVPYVQAGVGMVYTDAYKDRNQDEIGQALEFTPQASVGLKILLSRDWSIDVEGMYHHVSNASIASRNDGVNALGGLIGATYYIDKLWK
jgi:lipid A 3-O-deacylase